jgi:hypothetical protein
LLVYLADIQIVLRQFDIFLPVFGKIEVTLQWFLINKNG